MDLEKMTDEQLCDDACWSGRDRRTAAFNKLLRRLESLRAENERSHNAESVLASVTDLLNTCAREHGVEEARSEEFVKGVIERIWFRSAHYRQQVTTLKAENAVMWELCEAQIDYDSRPSQSANRLHAESTREATERRRKALEAYRAMEGKA